MGELSFAKLDKLPPMQMGKVLTKPDSKDMFRVIGPNNEVERFHGNFLERKAVLKRWKTTYITQSQFAHLVDWPVIEGEFSVGGASDECADPDCICGGPK